MKVSRGRRLNMCKGRVNKTGHHDFATCLSVRLGLFCWTAAGLLAGGYRERDRESKPRVVWHSGLYTIGHVISRGGTDNVLELGYVLE